MKLVAHGLTLVVIMTNLVSGVRFQVSAQPLADEMASLIREKSS
jgi:hypothetical protein